MSAVNRIPARILEEINKPNPKLIHAVRVRYDAPVFAHTGVGDQIIDNETYLGVGNLADITPVRESNDTSPNEITITLGGLDSTLVAQVLNERNNNKDVDVFWCSLDDDDRVDAFFKIFSGRTVSQNYLYDRENTTVSVRVADRLIDWSRKATERFSDESHRSGANSIGDRFYRFLTEVSRVPIYWGSEKDGPGFRF